MIISEHARAKYRQLFNKEYADDCVIDYEITEKFGKVKGEEINGGLVKRIIDNNFEEVYYYLYRNIRFVLVKNPSGELCLRTVEKNIFNVNQDVKAKRFTKNLERMRRRKGWK